MTITIVAAVCSAFATKSDVVCEDCPQYYLSSGVYVPVPGNFGEMYDCDYYNDATTCTYYKPNPAQYPNYYAPCRLGNYVYLGGGIKANNSQAKK